MSWSTSRSDAHLSPRGRGRRWLVLVAGGAALASGCGGRPDGVLALAFGLAPPAVVTLPDPGELGSSFSPQALAQASGKFVAVPPEGSAELTIQGLPPLGVPKQLAYYRFALTVGHSPVRPPSSALLRILRTAWPVSSAWAAEGPEERVIQELTPDALGRVRLALTNVEDADRITSGQVYIVLPIGGAGERRFKVLEGKVGNLAGAGEPVPGRELQGGGHEH